MCNTTGTPSQDKPPSQEWPMHRLISYRELIWKREAVRNAVTCPWLYSCMSAFRVFQHPAEWHITFGKVFIPTYQLFILRKGDVFHNFLGTILAHNLQWWNCKTCRNMLASYQSTSLYFLVEQILSIYWALVGGHVINQIFPGLCNGVFPFLSG